MCQKGSIVIWPTAVSKSSDKRSTSQNNTTTTTSKNDDDDDDDRCNEEEDTSDKDSSSTETAAAAEAAAEAKQNKTRLLHRPVVLSSVPFLPTLQSLLVLLALHWHCKAEVTRFQCLCHC